MIRLTDDEFKEFVNGLQDACGVDLRRKRVLLECRISSAMEKLGVTSYSKYRDILSEGNAENVQREMISKLITGYTFFCREDAHFKYLRDKVFPELIMQRKTKKSMINIWCAGCSTGEEAYSLAMAAEDRIRDTGEMFLYRIWATDINRNSIENGRHGIYTDKTVSNVPVEWRERYFIKREGMYEVIPEIRKKIVFRKHNLVNDPVPGIRMDVIFCRNVIIYFDSETRGNVIRRLYSSLNDNGYMFLGHAEFAKYKCKGLVHVASAVYKKQPHFER